jgi:hypothetical protein
MSAAERICFNWSYNTAVGNGSLLSNTTASNNTAVGYQAMYLNTTGVVNAAFGRETLASNTSGEKNAAFGTNALFSNTTASNSTAVGYQAGYSKYYWCRKPSVWILCFNIKYYRLKQHCYGRSALQETPPQPTTQQLGIRLGLLYYWCKQHLYWNKRRLRHPSWRFKSSNWKR